jgi:hypothetical protein
MSRKRKKLNKFNLTYNTLLNLMKKKNLNYSDLRKIEQIKKKYHDKYCNK